MKEGKQTLWTFVVITGAIASLCLGFLARTRTEMGSLATNKVVGMGVLASTEKFGETSESEYFYELAELLKQHYVEPIDINQKMASGAVRGMITSLLDTESNFYDPDQFKAFLAAQQGEYQGIGIDLDFRFDQEQLKKLQAGSTEVDSLLLMPEIIVASVLPGGPAETAGIQPGDEIRVVNGKNIVTGKDIKDLRNLQTAVTEGKATADQLAEKRKEIEALIKEVLPSGKVRPALQMGTSGSINLTIRRNKAAIQKSINKAQFTVEPIIKTLDGLIAVRFFVGAAQKITDLSIDSNTKIDLRNSGFGNFDAMERLLGHFLPSGSYGGVVSETGRVARQLNVVTRNTSNPKVTLLVDQSTVGAAAAFAKILQSAGAATLQGKLSQDPSWIEIQNLPDGSGYTLALGKFAPKTELAQQIKESK
jgi:carboxyl-terminal processing protease